MKIVVLDGYALAHDDLSWEALNALGDVTVYDRTTKETVVAHARGADILLTNKTRLREPELAQLESVRYIGVLATGYNIVDVAYAKSRGIVVTNVPSYGTDAVAQYVFALLLQICHHVVEHAALVREGKWNRHEDFCFWDYPLVELAGKTLGIVGYGRIGKRAAEIARAFGMQVMVYTRSNRAPEPGIEFVDFNVLVESADVISLHCPLTDETRGILSAEAFQKMKDGVVIINTARGPLIDETALLEGLKSGKVYAAGLDVLAVEPPREHHPLFDMPNCFVTPHIAWAPVEARQRLMNTAIDNVKAFIDGNPVNRV